MSASMAEGTGGGPEVTASLAQLAGLVLSEKTVDAVLQLLVSLAASSIPHTDAASVSVVRTGRFETSNATSEEVRAVDERQYHRGQGPCVEAIRSGHRHNIVVAQEKERWPEFATAALEAGFTSTLSTPLQAQDRIIGALNLYSRSEDAFGESDAEQAERFAQHAAAVLANAIDLTTAGKMNQQLQEAIGKAQGILMVRHHCTSEEAFDLLRQGSQRSNRKLREVAAEIVESEERQGRRR
jgi:GAF domain-containing protein